MYSIKYFNIVIVFWQVSVQQKQSWGGGGKTFHTAPHMAFTPRPSYFHFMYSIILQKTQSLTHTNGRTRAHTLNSKVQFLFNKLLIRMYSTGIRFWSLVCTSGLLNSSVSSRIQPQLETSSHNFQPCNFNEASKPRYTSTTAEPTNVTSTLVLKFHALKCARGESFHVRFVYDNLCVRFQSWILEQGTSAD